MKSVRNIGAYGSRCTEKENHCLARLFLDDMYREALAVCEDAYKIAQIAEGKFDEMMEQKKADEMKLCAKQRMIESA